MQLAESWILEDSIKKKNNKVFFSKWYFFFFFNAQCENFRLSSSEGKITVNIYIDRWL